MTFSNESSPAARLGEAALRKRLALEGDQGRQRDAQLGEVARPELRSRKGAVLHALLTATGLRGVGRRNALDIRVRRNEVRLPRLPRAFDGFTLLHMTDLHADAGPEFVPALSKVLARVTCDICVLTGDYRFATHGSCEPALKAMEQVVSALPAPAYAVLGNHDGLMLADGLERAGVRMLMNEQATLRRGGELLHIAGIDDAHYFRSHDLARAAAGVAEDGCAVLLSHTPEPFREAAEHGFSLMLCGHTHGGQICLPGGVPVVTAHSPRRLARGSWVHGPMQGYTSAGCGCAVLDARFFCPPEVVLHVLRCA